MTKVAKRYFLLEQKLMELLRVDKNDPLADSINEEMGDLWYDMTPEENTTANEHAEAFLKEQKEKR